MQVMPDDDVFFIMDVKPEDMGVYSCTAKNTAGMISANVTLTVLGKRARELGLPMTPPSLVAWLCQFLPSGRYQVYECSTGDLPYGKI